jgi:hypothetical protein
MVLGFFFVRPVPFPEKASSIQPLEDGDNDDDALLPALRHHNDSRTTLLNNGSMKNGRACYTRSDIDTDGERSNSVGEVMDDIRPDQKYRILNIHGKALWSSLDFWLLFSIYSMRMYFFLSFLFYL